MENSLIYDLLLMDRLGPYREELRKVEDYYFKQKQQSQQQLEQSLNGEQLKLLKDFMHYHELHEEDISFQVETRALNFGIKIGVQLQNSIKDLYRYFDEENEYE